MEIVNLCLWCGCRRVWVWVQRAWSGNGPPIGHELMQLAAATESAIFEAAESIGKRVDESVARSFDRLTTLGSETAAGSSDAGSAAAGSAAANAVTPMSKLLTEEVRAACRAAIAGILDATLVNALRDVALVSVQTAASAGAGAGASSRSPMFGRGSKACSVPAGRTQVVPITDAGRGVARPRCRAWSGPMPEVGPRHASVPRPRCPTVEGLDANGSTVLKEPSPAGQRRHSRAERAGDSPASGRAAMNRRPSSMCSSAADDELAPAALTESARRGYQTCALTQD